MLWVSCHMCALFHGDINGDQGLQQCLGVCQVGSVSKEQESGVVSVRTPVNGQWQILVGHSPSHTPVKSAH